jgi:hypothetical protein
MPTVKKALCALMLILTQVCQNFEVKKVDLPKFIKVLNYAILIFIIQHLFQKEIK